MNELIATRLAAWARTHSWPSIMRIDVKPFEDGFSVHLIPSFSALDDEPYYGGHCLPDAFLAGPKIMVFDKVATLRAWAGY